MSFGDINQPLAASQPVLTGGASSLERTTIHIETTITPITGEHGLHCDAGICRKPATVLIAADKQYIGHFSCDEHVEQVTGVVTAQAEQVLKV